MWNTPNKERLVRIPGLYATESTPLQQKVIHLHFFLAGSDWYAVEFDGKDIFWGFVVLNGDYRNSEWGYFSLQELQAIRVCGFLEVDCELEEYWSVRSAIEVEKIRKAQSWELCQPAR